jgi:hypothetical protein
MDRVTGSRWSLLTILGLAAALRFAGLGQKSLWIDEGTTVALARMPWGEFGRALWGYEANMTAYYLLVRAWLLLGDSEVWLRALSAGLGVAAVAALHLLGRTLRGPAMGALAAALLAVHPAHVSASQDARAYSLLVLLVILSTLFFVRAVEDPPDVRSWSAYVLVTSLAVYAHFFAGLVLLAQWLAAGPARLRAIGFQRLAVLSAAFLLLLAPAAVFIALKDDGQLRWLWPPGSHDVMLAVATLCGLNLVVLGALVRGLGRAGGALRSAESDGFRLRLLGLLVVVPIGATAALSFLRPLFFFRYFSICLPAVILLVSWTLAAPAPDSRRRPGRAALVVLAVLNSLGVTLAAQTMARRWSADWRAATAYVLSRSEPADALVFDVGAGRDAYRYYAPRLSPAGVRTLPDVAFPETATLASTNPALDEARLAAALVGRRRAWLFLHRPRPAYAGPDEPVCAFPEGFELVLRRDFPGLVAELGVTVFLYERKS